ncbi:myosin [Thraustotheca clavata]|uniref:Myosin n=1 Tax=Thraustotheca clavata TaxID=74557 RepID=A0A1W0A5N9_9STRA|nr:myosin [Thraustotheca clavata]
MNAQEVEELIATLSSRGSSKLRRSLTGIELNVHSLRHSLTMAAKWRQLGYSPFIPDAAGYTALHRAAMKGDETLIKSLLGTYEGNVQEFCMMATIKQGQTAMHMACKGSHLNAIRALNTVQNGRQLLCAKDAHGNTPLHFAATSNLTNAVPVLMYLLPFMSANRLNDYNHHGLSPLAAHISTTTVDNPFITRLFLERQVDPNSWVRKENTLLHVAVERKLWKIAGCLLEFGAEWNIADNNDMMVTDLINEEEISFLIKFVANCKDWATSIRKSCQSCHRNFNFLRRRHHCRFCGRVLCSKCSNYKRSLHVDGKNKSTFVRVCHLCVHAIPDEVSGKSTTDVTLEDPTIMEASYSYMLQ